MKALKELLDRPDIVDVLWWKTEESGYACTITTKPDSIAATTFAVAEAESVGHGRSPLGAFKRALKNMEANANES